MTPGPLEIALIALVVIILFGTRKLPELGSGLGKAISNFRKAFKETESAIDVTPSEEAVSERSAKKENSSEKLCCEKKEDEKRAI